VGISIKFFCTLQSTKKKGSHQKIKQKKRCIQKKIQKNETNKKWNNIRTKHG